MYDHSSIEVKTPYYITAYQLFAVALPRHYCQAPFGELLKARQLKTKILPPLLFHALTSLVYLWQIGVCLGGNGSGACRERHVVEFCAQTHPYKYFSFPVDGSLVFVLQEGPGRRLEWARELVFAARMRRVF